MPHRSKLVFLVAFSPGAIDAQLCLICLNQINQRVADLRARLAFFSGSAVHYQFGEAQQHFIVAAAFLAPRTKDIAKTGLLRHADDVVASHAASRAIGRPQIWVTPPVLLLLNASSMRQPAADRTRCWATLAPSQVQRP